MVERHQHHTMMSNSSDSDSSDDTSQVISFDISHLCLPIQETMTHPEDDKNEQTPNVITNDDKVATSSPSASAPNNYKDANDNNIKNHDKNVRMMEDIEDSDPYKQMYKFMLSKKKENGTMKERKAILFDFSHLPTYPLMTYFHPEMCDNSIIADLEKTLNKAKAHIHSIKNEFIASNLINLWKLLKESDSLPRKTRAKAESKAVSNFRKFMSNITDRIFVDDKNDSEKKLRKISSEQKSGDFVQDQIAFERSEWKLSVLPHPCPLCNHNCIVPHQSSQYIVEETLKLRAARAVEMREYSKLSQTQQKKTKPPKMPTFPKQFVACMCCVNKCIDFSTGKGCINCEAMVTCGVKIDYDPITMKTNCPMCNCNCTAYFAKANWSKLKTQSDFDTHEKKRMKMSEAAGELNQYIIFVSCC